jgi:hypothetical protein
MKRSTVQIDVVNYTRLLQDEEVREGLQALQKQVHDDFAPVWNVDAELHLVTSEEARSERSPEHRDRWALVLQDDEPVYDPTGYRIRAYHDLTRDGLPLAKVLVDRIPEGQLWTHAASHELLEMLADPDINTAVYRHPDAVTVLLYAREVCDPCASYVDGYDIGRWHVSDFVWPEWFQPTARRREDPRFDERRLIDAPFQLRPGGYIAIFDPAISAWTLTGPDGPLDEATDLGSRTERRSTADNRWMSSDMSTAP